MTLMSPRARMPLIAALAAAFLFAGSAGAQNDDYAEAQKLFRAGQHAQALERVDNFLKGNAKDARARFLKGLIFTEQNKTADAIKVFTGLTEDYPELPEPYNNLAVLYAQQGQYDKARNALELDRRDPWAHHAVAHCLEARGRLLEGVAFLESMADTWEGCNSFMYTHNWWHLALFYLGRGEVGEVLWLYDGAIAPREGGLVLELRNFVAQLDNLVVEIVVLLAQAAVLIALVLDTGMQVARVLDPAVWALLHSSSPSTTLVLLYTVMEISISSWNSLPMAFPSVV